MSPRPGVEGWFEGEFYNFCRNNVEPTELWSLVWDYRAFVSAYQMVRRGIYCRYCTIQNRVFNRFTGGNCGNRTTWQLLNILLFISWKLSGFRIPYHSGIRIPNHCGFRIPSHCGFRIPTAKFAGIRIPDSLTWSEAFFFEFSFFVYFSASSFFFSFSRIANASVPILESRMGAGVDT